MILVIFVAAVLSVAVISFIVYQNGLRYIKSDAGIKFFGNTDKNLNFISGRIWLKSDAATINLQKFYIVEIRDKSVFSETSGGPPDQRTFLNYPGDYEYGRIDVLNEINNSLRKDITDNFPLNNFIFNKSDDRILFRNESIADLIADYEGDNNILKSGEIYVYSGETKAARWYLVAPDTNPISSYKDFEIVQADNNAKKYKDDIIKFLDEEKIVFASFILTDGTLINLYPVPDNIYRINYDKGSRNGELYIGEIDGSFQKNGRGLYYTKSGDIYYGDFYKDEKTGKSEFLSDQGDSYSGEIENGKKNGEGIFKWGDGSSYTGTFKDNMKNGSGRNIFSDGSVYEGEYVNDVKHGKGKYIWVNGDVYEGDFADDLYKGKGTYTWANGDYYEGDLNYNTLHGWGTYYWTSGRSYEGWWNMGKMVYPEDKPDDLGDIEDTKDTGNDTDTAEAETE